MDGFHLDLIETRRLLLWEHLRSTDDNKHLNGAKTLLSIYKTKEPENSRNLKCMIESMKTTHVSLIHCKIYLYGHVSRFH